MIKRDGKLAQQQLSFGMIFSIILIIVFLAFAIYGITAFLKIQDSAKISSFVNEIQIDINNAWKSSQSSEVKEYSLPSKILMACFADFSLGAEKKGENSFVYDEIKKAYEGNENMFFYPLKSTTIESVKIENINIDEITSQENPFCLSNEKGKIRLKLVKDFTDTLVKIER